MKVKTIKKLILTKAEQKAIQDLYKILNGDDSLDINGIWDILNDIYVGNDDIAQEYGYEIKIVG